jgi:hypothetical protein
MSTAPLIKAFNPGKAIIPTIKKCNSSIEDFKLRSGLLTALELPDSMTPIVLA